MDIRNNIDLRLGDNLELLKQMPDNSVDSVVTDPPYGISFMGKKWDYDVPSVELWKEVLRVLKPGGHALVACGTRTQHRMAVNLEDAGFEIRDIVAWLYGSGFPKSYNISKAIEATEKIGKSNSKALRQVEQEGDGKAYTLIGKNNGILGETIVYDRKEYTPGTENAKKWEGWGTALKPAMELWTLCRKPLEEKTVAENVLKYGTGGINIDGCRVGTEKRTQFSGKRTNGDVYNKFPQHNAHWETVVGRFPANIIHDGSEEVVSLFPDSKAKFFYCAKASKKERNLGLDNFPKKQKVFNGQSATSSTNMKDVEKRFTTQPTQNYHPTVKPVALMRYLCKLITPPNGVVLDPFMGSGSTGIAALLEGFNFIGMEREEEYYNIAKARIDAYEEYK